MSAKNRLAYGTFEAALSYAAERYARGRLIDVGCGSKAWEPLFRSRVIEYLGVDQVQKRRDDRECVDVVADASHIPLADASAETVLLLEVLEHLEEPERALRECHRLLAPGGHIIATAPFIWPVHDQRDFFRYTPQAFRLLLEAARFDVLEVAPLGGLWTTLSLELSYGLQRYRRGPLGYFVDATCTASQWFAERWEALDFQPNFSWNHLVVAQRRP